MDIQTLVCTIRPLRGSLGIGLTLVLLAAFVAGCTRPADRPLDGARPGSVASANSSLLVSASPVSVGTTPESAALLAPAPSPVISVASPAPSPTATGRGPIISTIQPQSNANVPVGPVTISARISATSDVAEVSILVDGQALKPTSTGDARTPTYSASANVAAGQHQARIQVRDDQGRLGGFSWTFTAGAPSPPAAASPATKR